MFVCGVSIACVCGARRVDESSDGPVGKAAQLLGCSPQDLVKALCYRTVALQGETVTVPLPADKAEAALGQFVANL